MDRENLTNELQLVFDDIFDETKPILSEALTAADVPEWDSLSNIQLIVGIENQLSIKFSSHEVEQLSSVSALLDIILSKLK